MEVTSGTSPNKESLARNTSKKVRRHEAESTDRTERRRCFQESSWSEIEIYKQNNLLIGLIAAVRDSGAFFGMTALLFGGFKAAETCQCNFILNNTVSYSGGT